MAVQIIINGENAAESLNELSALAAGLTGIPTAAPVAAPETPKARQPRNKPESPKAEEPKAGSAPATDEPDAGETETEDPDKAETEEEGGDAEPVTVEQLRAKAAEVAKGGKQANVKALLDEFGAKSITLVPENERAAFLARLETL
ncbi:hypothetical protein ACFPPD_06890 [Cohnella suwonensis]|uniref:Uncharacterized protein n=1 Tax=Cohnella suwonensis TaxID=696072 RepID=A0ABW0LUS4_9BACL